MNHLSKCDFTILIWLNLSLNILWSDGVDLLSNSDFKMSLLWNYFESKGVHNLSKWYIMLMNTPDLSCDKIVINWVDNWCTCYLKIWTTLYLNINKIGNERMNNLSKFNFKKLNILSLSTNNHQMNNLSKCNFDDNPKSLFNWYLRNKYLILMIL